MKKIVFRSFLGLSFATMFLFFLFCSKLEHETVGSSSLNPNSGHLVFSVEQSLKYLEEAVQHLTNIFVKYNSYDSLTTLEQYILIMDMRAIIDRIDPTVLHLHTIRAIMKEKKQDDPPSINNEESQKVQDAFLTIDTVMINIDAGAIDLDTKFKMVTGKLIKDYSEANILIEKTVVFIEHLLVNDVSILSEQALQHISIRIQQYADASVSGPIKRTMGMVSSVLTKTDRSKFPEFYKLEQLLQDISAKQQVLAYAVQQEVITRQNIQDPTQERQKAQDLSQLSQTFKAVTDVMEQIINEALTIGSVSPMRLEEILNEIHWFHIGKHSTVAQANRMISYLSNVIQKDSKGQIAQAVQKYRKDFAELQNKLNTVKQIVQEEQEDRKQGQGQKKVLDPNQYLRSLEDNVLEQKYDVNNPSNHSQREKVKALKLKMESGWPLVKQAIPLLSDRKQKEIREHREKIEEVNQLVERFYQISEKEMFNSIVKPLTDIHDLLEKQTQELEKCQQYLNAGKIKTHDLFDHLRAAENMLKSIDTRIQNGIKKMESDLQNRYPDASVDILNKNNPYMKEKLELLDQSKVKLQKKSSYLNKIFNRGY